MQPMKVCLWHTSQLHEHNSLRPFNEFACLKTHYPICMGTCPRLQLIIQCCNLHNGRTDLGGLANKGACACA